MREWKSIILNKYLSVTYYSSLIGEINNMETIYVAGGCLWGVQYFFKEIPGIISTEAGRANGSSNILDGEYDGYAECVKLVFDSSICSTKDILAYLFEIIDPYSLDKQGFDVGKKYRTGIYSTSEKHLIEARDFLSQRKDKDKIVVEVMPLSNYIKSADEHQDHLDRFPEDFFYCHLDSDLMNKYRN